MKKPAPVCGEIANEPDFIPFLIGIGIETLSADPAHLLSVHRCVAEVDAGDARRFAEEALAETTLAGAQRRIRGGAGGASRGDCGRGASGVSAFSAARLMS